MNALLLCLLIHIRILHPCRSNRETNDQVGFPARVREGDPSACRHLVAFLRYLYVQRQQRAEGSRLSRSGSGVDDSNGGSGGKKRAPGYEKTSSNEDIGESSSPGLSRVVKSRERVRGRQPMAWNDQVGTPGCDKRPMKAGVRVRFSPSNCGGGGRDRSKTIVPRYEKVSMRPGVGTVLSRDSRPVSGVGRASGVHPVAGREGPRVLRGDGSADGVESAADKERSDRMNILRWMERLGVKV